MLIPWEIELHLKRSLCWLIFFLYMPNFICTFICFLWLFGNWQEIKIWYMQITDACTACFEQRTVFTQHVLERSLSHMVCLIMKCESSFLSKGNHFDSYSSFSGWTSTAPYAFHENCYSSHWHISCSGNFLFTQDSFLLSIIIVLRKVISTPFYCSLWGYKLIKVSNWHCLNKDCCCWQK